MSVILPGNPFLMQCPRKAICGRFPVGCKDCRERPDVGIIVDGEKTPIVPGRVYKLVGKKGE